MITYYISELFRSIRRAKLAFIISLVTACISVLFISLSAFLLVFSNMVEIKIKERAVLNIFLNSETQAEALRSKLSKSDYFSGIKFISKDKAAERFIKETGQDFKRILDFNPLPASFEVILKPEYVNTITIPLIKTEILSYGGVDEIVFEDSLIFNLLHSFARIKFYLTAGSIILFLISLYMVFSTNKLIIHSRSSQIDTMKLVGAKISAIKFPILLYGIFIGLLGSNIAALILFLLQEYFSSLKYYWGASGNVFLFSILYISGPLIGLLGSYLASTQVTLKIDNR